MSDAGASTGPTPQQAFEELLAKESARIGEDGTIVMGAVARTADDGTPLTDKQLLKAQQKQDKTLKFLLKAQKALTKAAAPASGAKDKKSAKAPKGDGASGSGAGGAPAAAQPTDPTTKGDRKQLDSVPFPNEYHPQYVESSWYEWWEKEGHFKPEFKFGGVLPKENPKGTFMMCIPPPNITGALHIGHGLTNAVQDTLVRWHRMRGETTLWLPGTDHAGIATQVVVEKKLQRERGVSRHDLGREAFVEEVWKWREKFGGRICNQLRRLGSSYDWSREVFTMDEPRTRAVTEAFVRLHEKKLIYRATRLVNWDCKLRSAISDLEVDSSDIEKPTMRKVPTHDNAEYEFGIIESFAYTLCGDAASTSDGAKEIIVATTRLETMLGDTGIAVNPDDTRYKHLIGKHVQHPFCDRRIPIVGDEHAKMDVGTGAVKITPAHDFNDYEVGKRHKLPMINMLTDEGLVNDVCGDRFAGMRRFDARLAIRAALTELGLYHGKEANAMVLPISNRTGDVVEPMLKPQWFVDCDVMAADAVHAVQSGALKLTPASHEKTWYAWLKNSRDWCISRQLWWGHRIPAFFVLVDGEPRAQDTDQRHWVVARTREAAMREAIERFQLPASKLTLEQDPDVLDTWFSSGLFPFSVFGWPDRSRDMDVFYPGSLLETGHDIIFFWVARMVFFGQHLMGALPFKEVYLHAMVRDAQGAKMSKTLGNVIDPIDVIEGVSLEALHAQLTSGNLAPAEVDRARKGQKMNFPNGIPECGTDALRFALLAYTAQGRSINLDIQRVHGYRKFCNKIWQATKFVLGKLGEGFVPVADVGEIRNASTMDQWILSRLSATIDESNVALTAYDFPAYTTGLYNMWLYNLCDVYLEAVKPVFAEGANADATMAAQQTLYTCLDVGLRLIAPAMPFLAEELWQRLPRRPNCFTESIHLCDFPCESDTHALACVLRAAVDDSVALLRAIAAQMRSLRASVNIPDRKNLPGFVRFAHASDLAQQSSNTATVCTLAHLTSLTLLPSDAADPAGCASDLGQSGRFQVFLECRGHIDVAAEQANVASKLAKLATARARVNQRRAVENYDTTVPEKVRVRDQEQLDTYDAEEAVLKTLLKTYESMV